MNNTVISKYGNKIVTGKRTGEFNLVRTTYNPEDVTILLKDLSGVMQEIPTSEREKLIQNGIHYSEMLPEEKEPSKEYEELYEKALDRTARDIATYVAKVASIIIAKTNKKPIIVSLARAGIPIGILIKRYIESHSLIKCSHYAISIIRDRGIDVNAMNYIYSAEIESGQSVVDDIFFVDGWTGKGVIARQINEAVEHLKLLDNKKWNRLKDDLYVLADPANITRYCGTREDFLLPSACLNSTVSGLTSRTILNSHIDVGAGEFHGAVYFDKFWLIDKSNDFLDRVTQHMNTILHARSQGIDITQDYCSSTIMSNICDEFEVKDYKKVKPGIGETTRVLLRRVPWLVLVDEKVDMETDKDIAHILQLCKEKNVPIERYDLGNYKVCGIIKELSADA